MSARSFSIPERGLIFLIGGALLASGAIFFVMRERPPVVLHSEPIVLEDVRVILPTFRDERKIDLNTATLKELVTLPGIGEVLAGRIITHRDTNGRFETVDALVDVQGIGRQLLEAVRELVTVESETTLPPG